MSQDCAPDAFREQIKYIHSDLAEVKTAIKEMASAMSKLALVEERQLQSSASISRAFNEIDGLGKKIEAISERVTELEKREPTQIKAAEWVERAVWAAAAGMCMLAASKIGLLG